MRVIPIACPDVSDLLTVWFSWWKLLVSCRIEWTKRHGHGCQLLVFNWCLVTPCYFVCLTNKRQARIRKHCMTFGWFFFSKRWLVFLACLPRKLPQLWHLLHLGPKERLEPSLLRSEAVRALNSTGPVGRSWFFLRKERHCGFALAFSFLFMSSKECTEIGAPQKSHRNVF